MNVNQPVPDFELPDLQDRVHRLREYRGRIVLVNFWSCQCPHSERTDQALLKRSAAWRDDVVILTIASNRNETAAEVAEVSEARGLPIVLLDAQCKTADLFEAQTTPHVFVMDRDGVLRYRGAVDDATFRQKVPARFFLELAMDALREGRLPPLAESPAYGCAIVREV